MANELAFPVAVAVADALPPFVATDTLRASPAKATGQFINEIPTIVITVLFIFILLLMRQPP
jgi:hypothetical protein